MVSGSARTPNALIELLTLRRLHVSHALPGRGACFDLSLEAGES